VIAVPSAPEMAKEPASGGRARAFALLGIGLLAWLLPVRSASQALMAASFALALVTFGLWGRLFGRVALGIPRLGPWTSIYLGQFAVLAAAAPLMALNGLAARILGMSLPLVALVAPPTLALLLTRRRDPGPAPRLDLLALSGLGSVALVVAVYSGHLSALGLDTHEHLAWIRQIVTRGYIPLEEPGTGIAGDYPRTFHALSALWNAAGLAAPAGPFAKTMPFLQTALPALALAEQMVDARARAGTLARRGWEIAFGLAFYAYAFLLVPMVYPTHDLSGTPRFSSGGLLLLPVLLLVIARIQQAPRAASAALTTSPLVAAWALTWNPTLPVMLLVATLPVVAAFRIALGPARPAEGSPRKRFAFGACTALGVLVLIQDPWFVSTAARSAPFGRLLHRAGVLTFDEAVGAGLATPREKSVRNAQAVPVCRDLRCVTALAGRAAGDALSLPLTWLRSSIADASRVARSPSLRELRDAFSDPLPVRPAMVADYAGLPFFVWMGAAVLMLAWRARRHTRAEDPGARMLIASLAGLAAAGVGLAFAGSLAAALNDQRHESVLLAGYLGSAARYVSPPFFWLAFSAATGVLVEPVLARPVPERAARPSGAAVVLACAGLALWLALPLTARLNLHRPLQHRGFWGPVGLADLMTLRRVEAAIPVEDAVIVPAEHANIANWEHWVLPLGETTALLPYGERRYLFNVYLGGAYPLSWRDLEDKLCSKDPEVRSQFLRRTRARWMLVRDLDALDAAAAVRQPRICGLSFAALGAELPAVREERGIFLFRIGQASDPTAPSPARDVERLAQ
jgi:hypothetical protein